MDWLTAENIIEFGGFSLFLFILYAESGLLFGLFLPGETLLVAIGMLASSRYLQINIEVILILINIVTVAGYITGFYIGKIYGVKLQEHSRYKFIKRYLPRAMAVFQKNEIRALIWWRFIPFIRTFLPIAAGISRMKFGRFLLFNILGSLIWTNTFILPGYYFGHRHEAIVNSLSAIVGILLFILILPFVKVYIHKKIKPILKRDYEKFHRWIKINFRDQETMP